MLVPRGSSSLCCIILSNDPCKRQDIHPSGASHSMLLYLGCPICRIKKMILNFLCKMPERCRERGGELLEGQHGWPGTQVTAVVHRKWRKIWFQLVLTVTVLSGPSQSLSHWQRKEMEGLNQLCDLLLTEMGNWDVLLALYRYSGFI